MPNALARETSPYLLQHADNPVDWLPWGEAAFEQAKREDKLVLVSIGYSTCHWCHVMEHESFENEKTAEVMNRNFLNVKVDREERPDVDATYMAFVQATTGHGGWPLNVWLTPDALPVVGGTYFPPEDKFGRPGFRNVCEQIAKAYRDDKQRVLESASRIMAKLREQADTATTVRGLPPCKVFGDYLDKCEALYDAHEGGFGSAPKFPRPSVMLALMRLHDRFPKDSEERRMAEDMAGRTLTAIAKGGIHDHLGGGFHRYSVDTYWHIPHYEKMLYDQAQLALAFTEAWQIDKSPLFKASVEDTLDYLLDEMRDDAGGIHSAEDADSLRAKGDAHKHEGAYWVWTADEIGKLLNPEAAAIFSLAYGVRAEGNARPESDPHSELEGTNTHYRAADDQVLGKKFGKTMEEIATSLAASRETLLAARFTRPKPHRDDKIITAWNGLAIGALAKAAAVFAKPAYLDGARKAAEFIRNHLWDGDSRILYRSFRGRRAPALAFPADFAFLIQGLIELNSSDPSGAWLPWAVELQSVMDQTCWDAEKIGYVMAAEMGGEKLLSIREDYDGAEPSPNHVAALNLMNLAILMEKDDYKNRAVSLVRAGATTLEKQVFAAPVLLTALDLHDRGVVHFQIPGKNYQEILTRLSGTHRPRAIFTAHPGDDILLCEGRTCVIFEE